MNVGSGAEFAEAISAELALLDWTNRGDRDALERILAPDFVEIGKSGRLWSRAEILDSVTHDGPREEPRPSDFEARLVAPNLVLLTFTTTVAGARTRRSSLWRHGDDATWQIVFHQGTTAQD